MIALYEFASAVWAATRFRIQRRRHLPVLSSVHRPGSPCAHACPCTCLGGAA
jgi:hypothetical protein